MSIPASGEELDFIKQRMKNLTFQYTFNGYTHAQISEFLLFFLRHARIYDAFKVKAKKVKYAGHEFYSARA